MSVIEAISATVAIPFLFTSVKMTDGWTYVDGGAAESTPAGPFLGLDDVLALKIAWSRPSPIKDFKTYALNILYSTMRLRAIYEVPTLDIDLGDSDVFDFGASNDGKLKMFLRGHALNFS